jgi:3-hydroxyacyl-CoA dehydrogenase
LHYADTVGLETVLARILEFRDRFGDEHWTPAPLLRQLVSEKSSIAEWTAKNAT